MKRTRAILVIIGFIIQFSIILSFFIPSLFALLDKWIPNYQFASVGAIVFVLSAQIAIHMYFAGHEQQEQLLGMKKLLQSEVHIDYLSEEDFYRTFLDLISNEAKEHVWITYLDIDPPTMTTYPNKKKYYEELTPLIRKKSVRFRRILRATTANLDWVNQLVRELGGQENFSLACYLDPDVESPSIPALSLQRIDDGHTFIVAMAEQEATTERRDMHIKSVEFTSYATKYYERLWRKSTLIIDRGKIKHQKLEELERQLAR